VEFSQWISIAQIILTSVLGVITTLLGAWVRAVMGRTTDRFERLEKRMEIAEVSANHAVQDEEWIRESMRMRDRLDKLGDTMARIEGKTDATLSVAMAVTRLAQAIEEKRDEPDAT